jgi:hypothetical protein
MLIEGCLFDCGDASNNPQGTAIKTTADATVIINASTIEQAVIGIECGILLDTNLTHVRAGGVSMHETTTSIRQRGSSALQFSGGSLDITTLDIANPTYVDFAGFNANGETHLAIGKITDVSSKIYEILNGQPSLPHLMYEQNYYGHKGTVYMNPNDNPTFSGTQSDLNDAKYFVVTGKSYKEAGISLISDTDDIGNPGNVRGWSIAKTATTAELVFTFTNNDPGVGTPACGPYNVMQLNGFNNRVEFPLATGTLPTNETAKLMWGGEASTNLYRPTGTPNTLKTDANFIVGGALTAGSTFVSTLTVGAGTATSPSLQFAGSTNTGFSAPVATPNKLVFSTDGVEHMSIDSTGTVSINEFTIAGVVHNNASGQLSSSLIVNADIAANAAIVDTKLATISTAGKVLDSATTATSNNIFDTIVKRDTLGNFAATVITARLTGTASENILRSGDSMTGTFTVIAGSAANPSLQFAGSTNTGFSAQTPNKLSFDTLGIERASLDATAFIAQVPMQVPYGSATAPAYTFSGDINTGIYDKAADTLGFATNGTERMTINSTGTVEIYGTLVLAAGTAAQPSLKFTNGSNTGLSSDSTGTTASIIFSTNGIERMSIAQTSTIFGLDQTSVTVTAATFIVGQLMALQSMEYQAITANTGISVQNSTSVFVFYISGGNYTVTISNFPLNPINGQLFTLLLAGDTNNRVLTLNNPVNVLDPATSLKTGGTNNITNTTLSSSIAYIYISALNNWIKYSH